MIMGCRASKKTIEIEISSSDSSSDFEPLKPLKPLKLYEPKRTETKKIVYDKRMIRAIFLEEHFKTNLRLFKPKRT